MKYGRKSETIVSFMMAIKGFTFSKTILTLLLPLAIAVCIKLHVPYAIVADNSDFKTSSFNLNQSSQPFSNKMNSRIPKVPLNTDNQFFHETKR